MAHPEKMDYKKWKVYFRDRKKTLSLWPINKDVIKYCNIEDRTKRKLKVELKSKHGKIFKAGLFTISSGLEVYFPKDFQDKIEDAFSNKKSYLTIEVLDD